MKTIARGLYPNTSVHHQKGFPLLYLKFYIITPPVVVVIIAHLMITQFGISPLLNYNLLDVFSILIIMEFKDIWLNYREIVYIYMTLNENILYYYWIETILKI